MPAPDDVLSRVADLQVAAMARRPDLDAGQGPAARGLAGHPARWRCDLRHPRVMVVDDVLHDEECAALVRVASRRAAGTAPCLGHAAGGAGAVHVSLAGPGLNAYESACRDHVDERLHALFDAPRDARQPLHVWHGAGAWPGLGHGLPGAASGGTPIAAPGGGACVGVLVCWLHIPPRGAWLSLPAVGLSLAVRRGTAVFLGPGVLAGLAGSATPATADGADATWIATQCFVQR